MMTDSLERSAAAIRPIFANHKLPAPSNITALEGGMVNHVFSVDGAYIVRFNSRDKRTAKFAREAECYRRLAGIIPIPNLILLDNSMAHIDCECLVTSLLTGQTLHDAWPKLNAAEREQAAFQAGEILANMHRVDIGAGFGRMESRIHVDWRSYIHHYTQKELDRCTQLACLPNALRTQIERVVSQANWLDAVTTPKLVHLDYHFSNIHYDGTQINGVYDFEWATAGDRAFDLKDVEYFDHYHSGSQEPFLAGYQSSLPLPDRITERSAFYQLLYEVKLTAVAFRYWGNASYGERLRNIERFLWQLL